MVIFRNTTVQDAPCGAESTRCNTNKWQTCLMLGMFRRRAGTHGTLSRKNVSHNVEEGFFVYCGATCKLGSTQQRACQTPNTHMFSSWSEPGLWNQGPVTLAIRAGQGFEYRDS